MTVTCDEVSVETEYPVFHWIELEANPVSLTPRAEITVHMIFNCIINNSHNMHLTVNCPVLTNDQYITLKALKKERLSSASIL